MNTTTFFKQYLSATSEEIPRLKDMASHALREDTDLTLEQVGGEGERLWRFLQYPYYLGIFARRVVEAEGISEVVKTRICHVVLQININLKTGQEPGPGLFQLAAWLYENHGLEYEDYLGLRRGLIWLPQLTDNYVETTKFIFPACSGLFQDLELTRDETIELILMILTAKESIADQGREIFDHIVRLSCITRSLTRTVCRLVVENAIPFPRANFKHPIDTSQEEKDRLLTRFLPGVVRRRAVVWLAKLEKKPIELLDKLLQPSTVRANGGDHVACGALDLLNEEWEKIDPESREKLLKQAADLPDTGVRKRAYILGEKYIGLDFLNQSLDDKAKSLREWARDRLDERENNPPPTHEELNAELAEALDD